MKSNIPFVSTILNFLMAFLLPMTLQMCTPDTQAKKIIYETDMCAAVDDVGALAMIHGLQNRGETELLAVCLNATGDPDGASGYRCHQHLVWTGRHSRGYLEGSFSRSGHF